MPGRPLFAAVRSGSGDGGVFFGHLHVETGPDRRRPRLPRDSLSVRRQVVRIYLC